MDPVEDDAGVPTEASRLLLQYVESLRQTAERDRQDDIASDGIGRALVAQQLVFRRAFRKISARKTTFPGKLHRIPLIQDPVLNGA